MLILINVYLKIKVLCYTISSKHGKKGFTLLTLTKSKLGKNSFTVQAVYFVDNPLMSYPLGITLNCQQVSN